MKKLKIKSIITIIMTIIIMFILKNNSNAVGTFSASISSTKVNVDDIITVKVKANNCAGSYSITANNSNVSIVSSGSGFIDNNSEEWTFKANKAGTVTIIAKPIDMTDYDNNEIDVEKNSKPFSININEKTVVNNNDNNNININSNSNSNSNSGNNSNTATKTATETKSSNANLSNLGIKPAEYDFNDFTHDKLSYTATVPYETEKVSVWYSLPKNPNNTSEKLKSTVKVSGGSKLKVGNNEIKVTVTAEDGKTTKTYTINVTRQEQKTEENNATETKNEQEQTQNEKTQEELEAKQENETEVVAETKGLKELQIAGITLTPEFSTDVYEYQATLTENKEQLDITANSTSEEDTVTIAGNENLQEGENLISIIVYNAEGEVEATYQITVTKDLTAKSITTNSDTSATKNKKIDFSDVRVKLILLVIILVIIAIILLRVLIGTGRQMSEYDEDEEDYDEEDENEFEQEEKQETYEYNVFKDEQFEIEPNDEIKEKKKSSRFMHKRKGKHF